MPQCSLDVLLQAAIVPNTGLRYWHAASSPPGAGKHSRILSMRAEYATSPSNSEIAGTFIDSVAPLNSTLDRGSLAFCQLRHVQQPRASCSDYDKCESDIAAQP
jgi:hypothetical protein